MWGLLFCLFAVGAFASTIDEAYVEYEYDPDMEIGSDASICPYYLNQLKNTSLAYYDTMYLYLILQNATGYPMNKTEYFPRVDEFSLLTINNSFGIAYYIEAHASNYTAVAQYRSDDYIVTWLTLFVTLTNGIVTGLEFENNCYMCDVCLPGNGNGTCAVLITDMIKVPDGVDATTYNPPNIMVHLAFKGTDKKGKTMETYGDVFSTYRMFSLTSLSKDLISWSKQIIRPVRV
ncbi:hypothetical protein PAPYR_9204 [Paratrimastix pyriformis]|uniref:Uncharacterized protein n=1 Tax=Paratrimastix pyriformis TaxID=342808 RepID=A0ABQ8UDQ1_9EUKA|nr:hypothetical protein PAPYR_9204 [Paratrimastix pyriformis]|eukprot:GAFH01004422.1.p1 GENE.GAFH01004422.1~~GAFH01004422.1.p1  ORF type:complete len:241 (+),score=23.00 GAFH01004422.1:26-724(+)